jgi:predicted  nucleic acid-binding Zn-ribbon protein
MPDPDRLQKIADRTARLEEQLTRSERLLDEVQKKLAAPRQDQGSNGQVAALKKDLEDQRLEFEALIGRLHEELKSVQDERDELARRLEGAAAFEDEPTDTYTPDKRVKKEQG